MTYPARTCPHCGHIVSNDGDAEVGALFHFEQEPMTAADVEAWKQERVENRYGPTASAPPDIGKQGS
jgi:hypothetical protein